jgi:hypothetical protein
MNVHPYKQVYFYTTSFAPKIFPFVSYSLTECGVRIYKLRQQPVNTTYFDH